MTGTATAYDAGHAVSSWFDAWRLGPIGVDVWSSAQLRPVDIASRQDVRLAELFRVAAAGSRFYRERLNAKDPASTPLAAMPVTTKSELMQRFDDWVTDPALDLRSLRELVADPQRIGEAYLEKYTVWESSGTSGQSGIFVQDVQAMAVHDALEVLRRSSPRPWVHLADPLFLNERMAFVGATTGHFASHVSVQRLRRINPWLRRAMRSFSILQSPAELMEELESFAPTVLATYPTAAELLAEATSSGQLRIVPQEIWTGGETLTESARERVQRAFGPTLRNSYGASEFLTIGWECSHGQMHANSDWVILEPVDEHQRPVPPGVASHSTLLTNLANHVQPLIRYDLGDQITVNPHRCACGSPLPVIDVQGRRDDSLLMDGEHGRTVTLLPLALSTVLEDDAGVFDFQLRQQDARTLVLRIGLQGAEAQAAMARCRTVLQAFAERQGLVSLQLVEEAGQPVPHGRSGKVQRVVACAPASASGKRMRSTA